MSSYIAPQLRDYGSLTELTRMQAVTGLVEDSNIKAQPFHHTPPSSVPAG